MPERGFLTETWTEDDWFPDLSRDQRYLFIYLITNDHVKQAGLYYLRLDVMSFESKFSIEELKELLPTLKPKVEWYPEHNLIWVRNFLRRQAKSPKFLVAAAKSLRDIKQQYIVRQVIEYNKKEHTISIPYIYGINTITIPSSTGSSTDTNTISNTIEGESEGEITDLEKVKAVCEYEELKVTKHIEEQLIEAIDVHGVQIVISAINKASENGHRNWGYIASILKNWAEGKGPGKPKESADKYLNQKYGHLFKR